MSSWFSDMVFQLAGWYTPKSKCFTPPCDVDLWGDWHWIQNATEEFLQQKSQESAITRVTELSELRKALKMRPYFATKAKELLDSCDTNERETLDQVLDSSKRSKIIHDVVHGTQEFWLGFVRDMFFQREPELWEKFRDSYAPKPYEKNIAGTLIEVGWQASHGPGDKGLTPKVLSDITWSFWKTLVTSIKEVLNRPLEDQELQGVADLVLRSQIIIVNLWRETVKVSAGGVSREGAVVEKWKAQENIEQARLLEIKKRGADARYEIHSWKEDWPSKENHEVPEKKDVRGILEQKLAFRVIEDYSGNRAAYKRPVSVPCRRSVVPISVPSPL